MDERVRECDVGKRALSYAEYGDPGGAPVLFCHGTSGSHLLAEAFDDDAAEAGVRLIAPDRPRMGRSDPQANRSLVGWART